MVAILIGAVIFLLIGNNPVSAYGTILTGSLGKKTAIRQTVRTRVQVTQNGKPREVTVEAALQHRTYQDALAGNRAAGREVLKMIAKREKWLAAKAPQQRRVEEEARRAERLVVEEPHGVALPRRGDRRVHAALLRHHSNDVHGIYPPQ